MGISPGAADHRFELLASASRVADGTLSLEETVDRLLGIVVPGFADLAAIDAGEDGGEWRRLGVRLAFGDPEQRLRLLERRRRSGVPIGMGKAIRDAPSQLLSPLTEEHLRLVADDEADLEFLRSFGLGSAMFIPLRARGRTIGALGCAVSKSDVAYDASDLRFAEVLAGRIALALDSAGLFEQVSGLERRFEAALENLAEAVLVRDARGRVMFANPAAAVLLDVESSENVMTAPVGTFMGRYDVFDEQGRRLQLADMPSGQAALGERPQPLLVRNVSRETGVERWLIDKATPVFGRGGEVALVVTVMEDVTEVKRAELAQRLLADAGRELASSLEYEQTIQRVAQLAVPGLADWCGVRVRDSGDILRQVAVAHVDPAKVALAREFGERYPPRLSDPGGAAEVMRTSKPQLITVTPELLEASNASSEQIAFVRELQMRSIIVVPMAIAGQPAIGVLTLVRAESGRVFGDDDLVLALELGRRAASAVENARLYTERSRIAATLQKSLLPPELPDVPGFRLASLYRAAGVQNDVGGDFYDVFTVSQGWVIVVGDVAGRGAEAAAVTSLARYTLRTAGRLLDDPLAVLEQLNLALLERPRLSLVSVCYVLVEEVGDDVQAKVILAGHPPAYHVHDGEPQPIGVFAPFLGLAREGEWRAASVHLEPGDQLVLYTDGVTDTVGESERFGDARLIEVLRGGGRAEESVQRIELALRQFAHGLQADDTAILAIERVPVSSLTTGSVA